MLGLNLAGLRRKNKGNGLSLFLPPIETVKSSLKLQHLISNTANKSAVFIIAVSLCGLRFQYRSINNSQAAKP